MLCAAGRGGKQHTITYVPLQAALDGSGNRRRILRVQKSLSGPSMLSQAAQVLIAFVCRNVFFKNSRLNLNTVLVFFPLRLFEVP